MTVEIRPSDLGDIPYLRQWLFDPDILYGFPMDGSEEIEDSIRQWQAFIMKNCGITAVHNGIPCGLALLYVQSWKKLAHTCLFSILVEKEHRNLGIGRQLLTNLMILAKDTFHIEILHLEVYAGNPACRLYERMGFVVFGRHPRFAKEKEGQYRDKICMEKRL